MGCGQDKSGLALEGGQNVKFSSSVGIHDVRVGRGEVSNKKALCHADCEIRDSFHDTPACRPRR